MPFYFYYRLYFQHESLGMGHQVEEEEGWPFEQRRRKGTVGERTRDTASQKRDLEMEKLRFFWDYERSILNSVLVIIFSGVVAAATILNVQVASPVIRLSPFYEDSALFLFLTGALFYIARLVIRFK